MVLRHHGLVAFAAVLPSVSGCSARYVHSASAPPAAQIPTASVSRHVVVVSIDGLRPDAIETYGAATLQRLMREGSYTLSGSTIDPSKTLPSHTSMLTGQPPERHGVCGTPSRRPRPIRLSSEHIRSGSRPGLQHRRFFQ